MGLGSAIAIYFIIWWLVFFAVLPIGRRDPQAEGARVAGSDHGAPVQPRLWRKAGLTTLVAAAVFWAVHWLIVDSGLTLDDVPLPSPPGLTR